MEDKLFVKEFQLDFEDNDAVASVALNDQFNFVKFILTDTKANANKQRIPMEEFDNLVKTGAYAPFKMAKGKILDGHDNAEPVGVITNLVQDDERIKCIAALWTRERPEDVELIKQAYAEKRPLNISWEIQFSDSEKDDEGVETLHGTSLRAATLVGMPAYEGRTPVFAFASTTPKEDDKLEELETLKTKLAEAETKITELETALTELKNQQPELEELRQYKASIEEEKARKEKLASIVNKFKEAGLEKDENYFESNKEMLLALDEATLGFMLQEMVSFASVTKKQETKSSIPNLESEPDINYSDPKQLAKMLKERLQKK